MRAVVDTNVLVSGLINPDGPRGKIVDWLRGGGLELVVDDRILREYADVLRRLYFVRYFIRAERDEVLRYLALNTHHVVCVAHVPNLPDPKDAPFFEAASTAAVPLVTGDTKHFPRQAGLTVVVMTPTDFVARHAARLGYQPPY